jgi:hypothetical protein
MPRQVGDGVAKRQVLAQTGKTLVLSSLKPFTLQTFQFYADGVVIAVPAAAVFGSAGMPGPVIAADELHQRAIASNVKV